MDFVYISYKLKLPDVFFFKSCALTCIISEDRDEDLVLKDASDHSVGKMVIKIYITHENQLYHQIYVRLQPGNVKYHYISNLS